ncbi:hypothetical protein QCA50_011421 [Cerrena zonata]|uniref:Aldehyde dehydrogenase n=1 Tax=Cerrena zonata TaxID=2478898 RepID=A0AAW0G5J3_9APHY
MTFETTPIEDIPKIREDLIKGFASGKTKDLKYRRDQLIHLAYLLKENRDRFVEALASDLHRPVLESDFLDLNATLSEIKECFNNVNKWAKPESPPFALNWFFMKPHTRKEPKGVVLVIGPFNFPVWCLIGPCASAIAAGNTVVLKPSEMCPSVASLIAELVPKYLDPDVVRVVNGSIPETTKLLEYQWGHVCYTGSQRVAKIIGVAAAKTLSPVTLELGGKSPVVIDSTADLKTAARRILWGKCANAGQICVAPDYVLVLREVEEAFIAELTAVYAEYFPGDLAKSDGYSRIVSPVHAARIKKMVDETKGKIILGGEIDAEERYIAPTIVRDVPKDDSLMSEEIFGPVLPIISVGSLDEAIETINGGDHPLVLYVFTKDKKVKEKVFAGTQSGAAVANDVLIHVGASGLPFGGIGGSGSGATTGVWGFNTFSHFRASIDVPGWMDALVLKNRFPPYTDTKMRTLRQLQGDKLPPRPGTSAALAAAKRRWGFWTLLALLGVISALLKKRLIKS